MKSKNFLITKSKNLFGATTVLTLNVSRKWGAQKLSSEKKKSPGNLKCYILFLVTLTAGILLKLT